MGEALDDEVRRAVERWGSRELAAAKLLVREALVIRRRQVHFSVLAQTPPSLPYHWERDQKYGVTFDRDDIAARRIGWSKS